MTINKDCVSVSVSVSVSVCVCVCVYVFIFSIYSAFRKYSDHLHFLINQTLCNNTWNLAQMPPISLDHCWDISTPWLESTCDKLHWLDMIWKGTHLSIKGLTADNAYRSVNQAMRSKELPAELRDRIVSRHRSGEGYTKKICCTECSQ